MAPHGATSHEHSSDLLRRHTVPRRLNANASVEEVWSALLKAQAKILGPEHPLVYRARYDFSISRRQQHLPSHVEVLEALRRTRTKAQETLGIHPLVSTFASDLDLLERTIDRGATQLSQPVAPASLEPKLSTESQSSPPTATESAASANSENHNGYKVEDQPLATDSNLHSDNADVSSSSSKPPMAALPPLVTTLLPSGKDLTPPPEGTNPWANNWRVPHKPRNSFSVLSSLVLASVVQAVSESLMWLHHTYGPEPQVAPGKVRVRWTCSCGNQVRHSVSNSRSTLIRHSSMMISSSDARVLGVNWRLISIAHEYGSTMAVPRVHQ